MWGVTLEDASSPDLDSLLYPDSSGCRDLFPNTLLKGVSLSLRVFPANPGRDDLGSEPAKRHPSLRPTFGVRPCLPAFLPAQMGEIELLSSPREGLSSGFSESVALHAVPNVRNLELDAALELNSEALDQSPSAIGATPHAHPCCLLDPN